MPRIKIKEVYLVKHLKYYVLIGILLFIFIGVIVYINVLNPNDFTFTDISTGDAETLYGNYNGRTSVYLLSDDDPDGYAGARFEFNSVDKGTLKFYIRFSTVSGMSFTMKFYSTIGLVHTWINAQNYFSASQWYEVEIRLDCEKDEINIYINDILTITDDFDKNTQNINKFELLTNTLGISEVSFDIVRMLEHP